MTDFQLGDATSASEAALPPAPGSLCQIVRPTLREAPEAETTDALGAAEGERAAERRGRRSDRCARPLAIRVGKPELRG